MDRQIHHLDYFKEGEGSKDADLLVPRGPDEHKPLNEDAAVLWQDAVAGQERQDTRPQDVLTHLVVRHAVVELSGGGGGVCVNPLRALLCHWQGMQHEAPGIPCHGYVPTTTNTWTG